jgi:hypothetical protein
LISPLTTEEKRHAQRVAFFLVLPRSVADALRGDDAAAIRTTAHDLAHGATRAAANDAARDIGIGYGRMSNVSEARSRHGNGRSGCRSRERGDSEDKGGGESES